MSITKGYKLPSGWAISTLPDLIAPLGCITDGDWVESKDQDPNGAIRLTQLADVGDTVFRDRSARFLTAEKAEDLRCTLLEPNDVMVARMPDPLGRACLFPGQPIPCITVVDVCIIRPKAVFHTWLMYCINSPAFRLAVARLQSGSTRKRISKKNLCTIRLPVPPLPGQHQIVEAIESYLTRLDDTVATLEHVERNLKRYRASVLKAAVEGRLVPTEAELARKEGRDCEPASVLLERILKERRRRWIEDAAKKGRAKAEEKAKKADKPWTAVDNAEALEEERIKATKKYKEPAAPDTEGLPELPEGWCWASGEQLTVRITKGSSPNWQGFEYRDDGIAFVRSQNVSWGVLDLSDIAHLPAEFNLKEAKSVLRIDDVLLNIVGASIGRAAVATEEISGGNTNQAVAILRMVQNGYQPKLAVIYLISPYSQKIIHREKVDVARANLSLADIADLPFPLPPSVEQGRICEEVDRQLTTEEVLKATTRLDFSRCQRLRQSILKWAFEGKLVDQDPNDEPASALLERIKAERAAMKASKKNNRKGSRKRKAK